MTFYYRLRGTHGRFGCWVTGARDKFLVEGCTNDAT